MLFHSTAAIEMATGYCGQVVLCVKLEKRGTRRMLLLPCSTVQGAANQENESGDIGGWGALDD